MPLDDLLGKGLGIEDFGRGLLLSGPYGRVERMVTVQLRVECLLLQAG